MVNLLKFAFNYKILSSVTLLKVILDVTWTQLIYIYILPRFIYIVLLIFYNELTHLTQKLKKFRLNGTYDAKLNFNWNPIFTPN